MSTATDMLALYIDAEKAVLANKTYTLNGVSVGRENLQEIRAGRNEWQQKVNTESAATLGGSRMYSLADFSE